MSGLSPSPSVGSVLPEVSGLARPILSFVGYGDIGRAIGLACESVPRERRLQISADVVNSEYYDRLTGGNIADLIAFLRSFENKSACGYSHETGIRVADMFLKPENCEYKYGYSGCGHPELNGLLLAVVLADSLLERAYPSRTRTASIDSPAFLSLINIDNKSASYYRGESEKPGAGRVIPISNDVRIFQGFAGESAKGKLEELADSLQEAYR